MTRGLQIVGVVVVFVAACWLARLNPRDHVGPASPPAAVAVLPEARAEASYPRHPPKTNLRLPLQLRRFKERLDQSRLEMVEEILFKLGGRKVLVALSEQERAALLELFQRDYEAGRYDRFTERYGYPGTIEDALREWFDETSLVVTSGGQPELIYLERADLFLRYIDEIRQQPNWACSAAEFDDPRDP